MATRRVTNRPSDDPGPCRRCAAARSIAADAPTYLSLGSHARSGLRMRRSPRRAVPCGRRNRASLSPTLAPEPTAWRRGSAYPDHRLRGWNRVASPRRVGRIRPHSDGNRAAPKGHGSRSPTSQPLHARSQLRDRCARMFRARIARQDRAGRVTLTAKSRLAPTANEAAPRDRSAIAQRVGAPAQTRTRAAATRRRAWLQSALRDAEPRPRSRGHRA